MNIVTKRTKIEKDVEMGEQGDKPKVLGIGVEGGFDTGEDEYEFDTQYAIVLLPSEARFEYPDSNLPLKVRSCVSL